jgi:Lon protease-like protein
MSGQLRGARTQLRVWVAATVALLVLAAPAFAQLAPMSVPELPETIALFPLPNVAALPFQELPLRVFEPRYRQMLEDVLAGNRVVGLVQIQPGFEAEYEGRPPLFGIGCAAIVVRAERENNGEFSIVVRAFTKFRIEAEASGKPYRLARVVPIPELATDEDREALHAERPLLEAALAASLGSPNGSVQLPPMSDEDLVSVLTMQLDLDTVDRQLLIERPGVLARARALIELLQKQADATAPAR